MLLVLEQTLYSFEIVQFQNERHEKKNTGIGTPYFI
jgi:hypothetical protein